MATKRTFTIRFQEGTPEQVKGERCEEESSPQGDWLRIYDGDSTAASFRMTEIVGWSSEEDRTPF